MKGQVSADANQSQIAATQFLFAMIEDDIDPCQILKLQNSSFAQCLHVSVYWHARDHLKNMSQYCKLEL